MKTSDQILHIMKRNGAITAKQLAEELAITTMGVRQHLTALQNNHYVEFEDHKAQVGRPRRYWSLTSKGHAYFSDRHNELSIQVIDAVERVFGESGLAQIIEDRQAQTLAHYQAALAHCSDLPCRLLGLVALREKEGYMAELITDEQGYWLVENHCPIHQAAARQPLFCQSELQIFRQLLGEDVAITRTEHTIAGERRCCYRILPT